MTIFRAVPVALFVLPLLALPLVAQEGEDHPLISRYQGSEIKHYHAAAYDEFVLPLAASEDGELTESLPLEGAVTRIVYEAPESRSALEIIRNYEQTLENAGFETLFECAREECGRLFGTAVYDRYGLYPHYTPAKSAGSRQSQRYLAAEFERPEGNAYVSVHVAEGWWDGPTITLDVVEVEPLETDKVVIDAEALADELNRTGKVAIYGIYFDTGSSELKPESDPSLEQIATLLRDDPDLDLYVVGHTDDTGSLSTNMSLSAARAAAVVEALVADYGIDGDRLDAHGVGPLAPVSSNEVEAGRAENRRVELVLDTG